MADLGPGGIVEALFRLAAGVLSLLAVTSGFGPSEDGPSVVDGEYEVPAGDEIIIRVVENNGPVSPEFQTGYSVEIDANGHAEYVFTPAGASGDMTDPTAAPQVTVAELGEDGVQSLLQLLDATGVFDLDNPDDEAPPGASVDLLEVTLDEGTWVIQNVALEDEAAAQLDLAQALIVATVRAGAAD